MKNLSLIKVLVVVSVILLPLLVILSQKHQPAFAYTSSSQVTVTVTDLNVREAADISSKIIDHVHQGETFEFIQTKNNWDQIKLSNNQTGWVKNAYVTPTENLKATVEAIVLNVRTNPSLSSQIVGRLTLGTKITVYKEQAGWAKIEASSGVQGWVNEYYITKDSHEDQQTHPVTENTAPKTTSETSPTTEFKNSQGSLKGKTIVLDPGHGGIDDGTTSITGTPEKTLTLATAKVVAQKLENAGANVVMTRTDDTYIPLQQRADLSNKSHADAFISFHYNWSNDPSVNGLTDFYYQKSRDNPLAADLLNEVVKTTGLNSVGTSYNNLDVLRNNSQPSTLIELGFVSNKQEDSAVESSAFRDNVAQGVYQGLLEYFSIKK